MIYSRMTSIFSCIIIGIAAAMVPENGLTVGPEVGPQVIAEKDDLNVTATKTNLIPVLVKSFFTTSNSFYVALDVQNIAYTKKVEIDYCLKQGNYNRHSFPCSYSKTLNSTYEAWVCAASSSNVDLDGLESFTAAYFVNGQTFHDNGPNGAGYAVSMPITTATAKPTFKTTTTAIAPITSSKPIPSILPGCQNYNGLDSCQGNQFEYSESEDTRKWQTPNKSSTSYTSSFQNYGVLTGYTDVEYNSDLQSATLTVKTFTKDPSASVECNFNSTGFSKSKTFQASASTFSITSPGLTIICRLKDIPDATLELDDFYFSWQNPSINRPETNGGQKGAIVELLGWPYTDIEQECQFLGKAGYMGLRVWAPNEHLMSDQWLEPDGNFNPWYFSYQPVSYRLKSRQGTLEQLRSMVLTCRKYGVRVYADAVVNHMTGNGNAVNEKRNPQGSNCVYWGPHNSTAGSPYYTHGYTFKFDETTGRRPALEFPAVPYSPSDFHCERSLNSYTSGFILQYGWLSGLADLNTGKEKVRERIATYYATLLSVGFSGFRVDAGKHISPDDHAAIFAKLSSKMGGSLPSEFITYLEVLIGGEKDLLCCGYNDYNYYSYFTDVLKKAGLSGTDIQKIKIWSSDYPKEFPVCGTRFIPDERFVIQNDDHDQQNAGSSSRDMQDKGSVLIVHKDIDAHRRFEVQLFTRTDGNWQIRQILSSYYFEVGTARSGWPDGLSDCSRYTGNTLNIQCKGIPYNKAYQPEACGYSAIVNGAWQVGAYTRVHRDLSIVNAMRHWMGLGSVRANDVGLPSRCT